MDTIISVLILLGSWIFSGLVNLLADQLPIDRPITEPTCLRCNQKIPLSRYMLLSACPGCGARARFRQVAVHFLLPLISVALWFFQRENIPYWLALAFLYYFSLITIIDIEHRVVLGPLSIIGIILGAIGGTIIHGGLVTLLGGFVGTGVMLVLYFAGRLFSAWMSNKTDEPVEKEALGFGDVYVSAIIGLVLGWPGITLGLLLSILAGGLISGGILIWMMITRKYHPFSTLPYAPFMTITTLVLLLGVAR